MAGLWPSPGAQKSGRVRGRRLGIPGQKATENAEGPEETNEAQGEGCSACLRLAVVGAESLGDAAIHPDVAARRGAAGLAALLR